MKILLTGEPGVGKSTILRVVRDNYTSKTYGIISNEILENGKRVGFEAVNSTGERMIFSHTKIIHSSITVGNKYHVDLNAIDNFVVPELQKGLHSPDSLVFIDEIGRMQSFSSRFIKTIQDLLISNANILATIVADPEAWSIPIKKHPAVVLIQVNESNRSSLPLNIISIFQNIHLFNALESSQKLLVTNLLNEYLLKNKNIQINKLFKNAIRYFLERRIHKITDNMYKINGDHTNHLVKINNNYSCDCNLYNGHDEYENKNGECSHIQSVKLFDINK